MENSNLDIFLNLLYIWIIFITDFFFSKGLDSGKYGSTPT